MGEQRTCVMTSKRLSSDLGISREAARDRIHDLAAFTIGGRPLIRVRMTRAFPRGPGRFHITYKSGVSVQL